jgi:O-antigen/teichoic acid export membrane protein
MGKLVLLLRGSAAFSLMRVAGAGASFVAQAILATLLQPRELGLFFSATSAAAVAALVATQGYPQIAPRFISRYGPGTRRPYLASFLGQAAADGTRAALAMTALLGAGAFLWPATDGDTRLSFALAAAMVIALASIIGCGAVAGAQRRFELAYIPDSLARPVAFLALVAGLAAFSVPLSAGLATALFAFVAASAAAVQFTLLRRSLPRLARPGARLARHWRAEAWPLILLALFTNLFADIGILCATPFLGIADVAVFGLCLKLALLVGFVVQVAQQIALPDLADARRDGDADAMRRAVRRSVVLPVAVTFAGLAGAALFGDRVLAVFGPAFVAGQPALVILVGTQLLRALAGPGAHLLTLAGAQTLSAAICAGALGVLVLANLALAPPFGVLGAAFAVLLTFAAWTAATALALRRLGERRTDLFGPGPALAVRAAG